jgi:hypothetical protein
VTKRNDEGGSVLSEELSMTYSEFVKNLDKWLHLIAKRGDSEKHLVELASDAIRRNMISNAQYYRELAVTADKKGDYAGANRYKLIAKLYNVLCKN